MKILLTGANGFLGKVLYSHLISNFLVKTLSRSSGDYIADLSKEMPLIADKFDIIIHAAGKAHSFPKSREDRDSFYKVNVQGTKNLLEGLENYKLPKSFVFISTVAVYGVSEGNLINEQTELNSIDPYGQSKVQAEQLVSKWCTRNNVTCTILRLPLVVGWNPPGNLGAMIKGINNGYYFNIAGGSAKKSMVLASDITNYLIKASEIGGIFNLTDGYHPSFFELSENISRQIGKSRPINMPYWLAELFARIGDLFGDKFPLNSAKLHKITSDLTFDDSKAREILGWNPKPVLEGFKLNTNSTI
jgi:nucleoside-diphosphate-sugar epimerase